MSVVYWVSFLHKYFLPYKLGKTHSLKVELYFKKNITFWIEVALKNMLRLKVLQKVNNTYINLQMFIVSKINNLDTSNTSKFDNSFSK